MAGRAGGPRRGVHLYLSDLGHAREGLAFDDGILPLHASAAGPRRAGGGRTTPPGHASTCESLLRGARWPVLGSQGLVLWIHAIADVGAGVATVLGNLQVLFIAAFAWAVLNEQPGRRYLITLPVVLLGVVMVSGLAGDGSTGLRWHPAAGVAYRSGDQRYLRMHAAYLAAGRWPGATCGRSAFRRDRWRGCRFRAARADVRRTGSGDPLAILGLAAGARRAVRNRRLAADHGSATAPACCFVVLAAVAGARWRDGPCRDRPWPASEPYSDRRRRSGLRRRPDSYQKPRKRWWHGSHWGNGF